MVKTFKEQSEEVKKKVKGMGPVKIILLVVAVVLTVCSFVFNDFFFKEGGVFDGIYKEGTSRPAEIGPNGEIITPAYPGDPVSGLLNGVLALVPGLVIAIRIITITLVILTIALAIINAIFKKNNREITIARLINNIIRVIVWVGLVIAVLAVWGIDTTALITGAGVITLIVGLGMQSLIGDVVAGLFIVFENEFNVGDIITIDGFRGEVVAIGIRTTKLEALGNIKIINNSDIRGVLNQTVKPSTAYSYIDVEYGESLSRIDGVINEKLPAIKIEGVIGEISYDGVSELGASGVTLQFTASCYEGDIFAVQREMNKQLKNMFDENGIGIPFPQLVVHNATDSAPVQKDNDIKIASKKEKTAQNDSK